MPLLITRDEAARVLLFATAAGAVAAEVVATYRGQQQRGDGRVRLLGSSLLQTTFLRSSGGTSEDRGTKRFLVLCVLGGILAATYIARDFPSLRAGANAWPTLIVGIVLACLGIALRTWSVWSLGKFFQRDVMVQEGHVLWRGGPYRCLRHPAYAGNLLSYFGLGLAIGSWVGAFALLAIALVGHIPRIRVEETALTRAFGDQYREYAAQTARLVPGVW